MRSKGWKSRAARYRRTRTRCEVCYRPKKDGMHVHHIRYDHLGNEPDDDLLLTCRKCHVAIHAIAEMDGITAAEATQATRRLAVVQGPVGAKQAKKRKPLAWHRHQAEQATTERKRKLAERRGWVKQHTT